MSFEAFDAPGAWPPAWLPDGLVAEQGITTLRYATAAYATRSADALANTPYAPRILGDVTVSQSAADGLGIGGVVALTSGEVRLWDADGALADMDRYGTADGRAAVLRVLPVTDPAATDFGQPFGAADIAFRGVVRSVQRAAGQGGAVALADVTERLLTPLQPNRYLGTGGLEGGDDLKDRPKPVCVGRCYNIAPVYLGALDLGDGALHTFQAHWRAVEAVDAVRIRGVAQTLVGTTPTVGQARVWASQGLFQLGSSPDGSVTADVRGDNTGGYVSTTADVIYRLLEDLGPQFEYADWDHVALEFADTDLPGEVGWYRGAEAVTAMQAVEEIVAGAGAVLCGARDGTLRLFDPLARDVAQFELREGHIISCEPLPLPGTVRPLPVAAAVRWRPNWAPVADVAAAVPAADRQALTAAASGPERVVSLATQARQAQQRDLTLPGLYWAQADAAARAQVWADWIEHGPRMFRVVTDRYLGQIECGHIGRVTYPAYGLDTGALGVVLGWQETLGARRCQILFCTIPEG